MPLQSPLDASVLAEQHASLAMATQLLAAMVRRKLLGVVPPPAANVARQGRWATAAQSMSVYLSNQCDALITLEVCPCVEACV